MNIVIYGYGMLGVELYLSINELSSQYKVIGIADNSIYKQWLKVGEMLIQSLEQLVEMQKEQQFSVIIAANNWWEIGEQLLEKDIPIEGQIIRVADEFDAIVSKRQYKTHIGITDTLKLLVKEAQPIPKVVALKSIESNTKLGKLNPKIVRALFAVVIEDTEYEISCIMDYMKYIKEQIKRLEIIKNYNYKMQKTKSQKKKDYLLACMESLFEGGENVGNFIYVLEEYSTVHLKKKEHINNLFNVFLTTIIIF